MRGVLSTYAKMSRGCFVRGVFCPTFHIGRAGTEYREVHGGMGYGRSEPDVEGERILEYALAFDLLLVKLLPSGNLSRH